MKQRLGWQGRRLWGAIAAFGLGMWLAALLGGRAIAQMPALKEIADTEGHWANACIAGLVRRQIMDRDRAGRFRPQEAVTRAEYASAVSRALPAIARAQPDAKPAYRDVPASDSRFAAIHAAYSGKLLPDTWRDRFDPDREVQRFEAAIGLARGLALPYLPRANAMLQATFADALALPPAAREYVAAALAKGVLVHSPEKRRFAPSQALTRGELAAMLCRTLPDTELAALVPSQAVVPAPVLLPPRAPRAETRAVWLTNVDSDVLFSRESLTQAIARLADLNFNTVYPTVWNWGYTLYPSRVAERVVGAKQGLYPDLTDTGRNEALEAAQGDRDMLQELLDLAHPQGISVVAWFEFGFMLPANSPLVTRHPDWLTQKRDGSRLHLEGTHQRVWLNPFHPEAQRFLLSLIDELVTQYDLDGIQFDDHFGLPVAFGYDPYTVALYRAEHGGKAPPADPKDPVWVRWRADRVTAFLGEVFRTVKARRPQAMLSISPNPYPFAYDNYLQDWPTWQRRGYIEELVVQVYRSDLTPFVDELNREPMQEARRRIPTLPGILSGLKPLPVPIARVQEQVVAARDRGYAGVSFFFYESLWNFNPEPAEVRASGLRQVFGNKAKRVAFQ